jgi:homoserine kinase type II
MPMNVSELLTAWPMRDAVHIEPIQQGINNHVWRVDAADGQRYVLRVLPGSGDLPRVRFEATLLDALSEKPLPFRLPLPLKSNSGDIVVSFERETGSSTIATLHPFLPGSKPDRNDSTRAAQAGTALAMLDTALAALAFQAVEVFQSSSPSGDGDQFHALIADSLTAIEQLPVERDLSRRVRDLQAAVREMTDDLFRRLPQQLLHRDCGPGNMLVDASGITAVLDFEFAGRDIRILDLCVALSWWPVNLMGTGKEWEVIDAFGAAYVQDFSFLSEAELRAIPDLLRLRDAGSLTHRIGRYLAGLESDAVIESRLKHSLWREEWLSANQERLLDHVFSWTT